jgi:exodeoxyribonuclease VII small subunit
MAKAKDPEKLSYEQAFAELEETVALLEGGDQSLERALELFERGQALAERCSALLANAELKLKQLVPDEAGDFEERELDLDLS